MEGFVSVHAAYKIFELASNAQGQLNRTGLYKALALCALAQLGKTINDKILESFSDKDLPVPSLAELSELQRLSTEQRRKQKNSMLTLSFHELNELDSVKVDLVPEKKGVIIKHVEYNVTSQRYKVTVGRRYNDFHALHETLIHRYPYRIIPSLPPKKIGGISTEFLESRRKSLRRFLNIIAKHPVIAEGRLGILKFFLTFTGSDCQSKLKEQFRNAPDEFMTNELALKAKELVPMDTQVQYSNSRTFVAALIQSVNRLKDISERLVKRSLELSVDMKQIAVELSTMTSSSSVVTSWATGPSDSWDHLQKGFKHLSVEYSTLSEKATRKAANEELRILEELEAFLALLMAYRDLCDRHQKGVLNDHQRALNKMGSIKKKQMHATVRGSDGAGENFESRILAQESAITNMENRNYFSLHCIQMETQLIHSNMMMLSNAFREMAGVESAGYSELSQCWQNLLQLVERVMPSQNGQTSPPTSPSRSLSSPGITL
ncbi:sorting nexin-8-like isoform X2 [Watersipora subatra]|uniref:sorting nexin-8-like isoform X2 n=1 Tax=Watersipora subatra TaxID=2589382 RepID=UPI00355C3FF8